MGDRACRIACLLVPDLPLVAALRARPEWAGRALAITAGAGSRAEILTASPEALRLGVRPGQTAVRARAVCADLELQSSSPALEDAARAALLDAALSTSPRAELAPPAAGPYAAEAAVHVDASGVRALFHSEAGFAGALASRAARLGLPAVVAIAGSRTTAQIAARHQRRTPRDDAEDHGDADASTLVVPPGQDAHFLAPLPIDLLDPDDGLAERLSRFGIRRVGDLLRLPSRALGNRLGAGIQPLLARARGEEPTAPPAAPHTTRFEEAFELEAPVDRVEPLAFVLRGMLTRLVERLDCRGFGCGDLELELGLDARGRDARRVGVAAPTADVRVLLRLLTLSLETRPPTAAVERATLATRGRPLRGDQLDLFRPAGPAPAPLGRALAELEALCGPGRVGAPVAPDSHRPDAWDVAPFVVAPGGASWVREKSSDPRHDPAPGAPRLGVRALRPPLAAQVRLRGTQPVWVASAFARGAVVHAAGPWRTTGGWWTDGERFAFDHYDVQTDDGSLFRLRLDRMRRCWEIDAVYD